MTTNVKDAMARLLRDEPAAPVDVQRAVIAGRSAQRARRARWAAGMVCLLAVLAASIPLVRGLQGRQVEPASPRGSEIMYQIDELLRLVQADGRGDDRWPSSTDQLGRNRPDWSWDGTRVAFNRGTEIWVANADGSDEHRVVACSLPCTNAEDPSWSPDGTRIAYWSNGDSITTQVIRIASATDGRTLQTIKADAYLGPVQPRWAPDGRTLAVTLEHYVPTAGDPALDSSGIGVIDLTEPVPRITLVAPFSLMATYPAWSPSGDRILFTAGTLSPESTGSPGASNLYVVNRDGTKLVQLTHQKAGQARLFEPDWTANPKQIVLVLIQPDGAEQLATIAPDATDLQPIVDPTSGQPITGKHPRQTRPPT